MPITSAARLASLASSSVQQPRAPVRYDRGLADRARWTPVTSWPAEVALAAATAESTPPDMAASTRMLLTAPLPAPPRACAAAGQAARPAARRAELLPRGPCKARLACLHAWRARRPRQAPLRAHRCPPPC